MSNATAEKGRQPVPASLMIRGKMAEAKKQARTLAAPAALRPYLEDPWRLLNAKPAQILEAAAATGEAYPPGQAEDLAKALEALREMFALADRGRVYGPAPREVHLWGEEDYTRLHEDSRRMIAAQKKTWRLLDRHLPGVRHPVKAVWSIFLGEAPATSGPNLFAEVLPSLRALGYVLGIAEPSSIFVCDWCGRIGAAERSDKHYCGGSCRKLAARKRAREGTPKTR